MTTKTMTNVAFDTLTVSKNLQDAGIEPKHAEAIALAVKDSQGELATKQDILATKQDIRQEIQLLKADIEKVKTELKTDITWIKWSMAAMMAIMIGGFSLVIAN